MKMRGSVVIFGVAALTVFALVGFLIFSGFSPETEPMLSEATSITPGLKVKNFDSEKTSESQNQWTRNESSSRPLQSSTSSSPSLVSTPGLASGGPASGNGFVQSGIGLEKSDKADSATGGRSQGVVAAVASFPQNEPPAIENDFVVPSGAVELPLVLYETPANLNLTESQERELVKLADDFLAKTGATNSAQNPADEDFTSRWKSQQFVYDELLRSAIGWEAFNRYSDQVRNHGGLGQ